MLTRDEYKAVFDASPDGCIVVASDGTIQAVNPKAEELFGWSGQELAGKRVEVLMQEALAASHQLHRERFVRNPHDRPMAVGLDLQGSRKDGSTFPIEVSLSPWESEGKGLQVICSIRDVGAYRRLQNFSEGALRASEEERQRIARELHDDTAQRLATLILRVRVLAEEAEGASRTRLMEEIRAEIVEASDGVRRMARGLRPPEIEELGLVLALQAHIRNLKERVGYRVDTELGVVDPYLDETAKLALYRIIQEALSNAQRHSGADSAAVRLAYEGGNVVAEVSDEGGGFSLAESARGDRGLGLIGMQERAAMIGGRITVDAVQGEGTRVRVVIPAARTEKVNA